MLLRIHPGSGVPIYLQLIEQVRHAIETGALKAGDQLPSIRAVAEDLAMNPNTVARAYREMEHLGLIDVRHGSGAYVSAARVPAAKKAALEKAARLLSDAIDAAGGLGLTEPEIRRVFESELTSTRRT